MQKLFVRTKPPSRLGAQRLTMSSPNDRGLQSSFSDHHPPRAATASSKQQRRAAKLNRKSDDLEKQEIRLKRQQQGQSHTNESFQHRDVNHFASDVHYEDTELREAQAPPGYH